MSVELVKREILRFLSSNEPEVLSISGEWGIGKTFCWKTYLEEAQNQDKIALDRYAYVSLFGVNSLDELKYSTFENTVKRERASKDADLDTFVSMLEPAEKLGRKYLWLTNLIPGLRTYFNAASPAFFLMVRKQIICIDDFERKGAKLDGKDVLGLVSFLKEQRSCKVALLLNSDALPEKEKIEFDKYLEKVVDTSLKFLPSPAESVHIALPGKTEVDRFISEDCMALGISNIRIIRKVSRLVKDIEPQLKQYDKQVLRDAVKSLTLFTWSFSAPEKAPSLTYIKTNNDIATMASFVESRNKKISPEEAAWNALLRAYGFRYLDKFDKVLLAGVEKGYFDSEAVQEAASYLNEQVIATASRNSFEQAWEVFHGTFFNTPKEIIDTIHKSFLDNVQYISRRDLNGTVWLFKEAGEPDLARQIIELYIEKRSSERNIFDLSHYTSDKFDPDVVNAFEQKLASFKDNKDAAEILGSIANRNDWNADELTIVSEMPVDDYHKLLKFKSGKELNSIISFCLQFDRTANATSEMKAIASRAREALERIGKESNINALRVKKYGVEVKGNSG